MNKYLALTIGPIYRTINASQRTRMLWGASFLFSFLIRELTKLLNSGTLLNEASHPECKIAGAILIPYAEGIENDQCIAGEGKYPDRILIHSEEGDFEKVQKAIETLIGFLANEIASHLSLGKEVVQIERDLTDYLQFYFIEKEVGEKEIAQLSLYENLDVLERRNKYLVNDSKNYLFRYLFYLSIRLKDKEYSLIAKEAFPNKVNKRFRSLIEISTAGFSAIRKEVYDSLIHECFIIPAEKDDLNLLSSFREDPFDDDDEWQDIFISKLKKTPEFSDRYKKAHQYFAVIYVDGDHIGDTLKKIGGIDTKLNDFSKMLLAFNTDVVKIIDEYGGAPVYIGGDDTFAFVPLISIKERKSTNIFNLIQEIDKAFGLYFTEDYSKDLGVVRPTLSFGIAIAYFKNPLYETMEMAHKLLGKAKKVEGKNAIELILEEHSGQQFRMSIQKKKKGSYDAICNLMEGLTSKVFAKENEEEQEKSFINSITHKLKDPLFKALLLSVANDHRRLDEFFANSFNEPIHKGEMKPYIEQVKALVKTIFSDYCNDETRIDNLYSTLRLIDFMHKNPKDE